MVNRSVGYRLHHFSFKPKFKYAISKEYALFFYGDDLFVHQAFLYAVYIWLTAQRVYFRNRLSGKSWMYAFAQKTNEVELIGRKPLCLLYKETAVLLQ